MGKDDKLLARLQNRPKDFSFQELATLLVGFGYVLNQGGSGSRIKFEGSAEQFNCRHSGESRNPVKSITWTPAFAGVTNKSAFPEHERCVPIFMHKPHLSPLLKPYQIDQVLDVLKQGSM